MAETWDRPTLEDRVNEQREVDAMLLEWVVRYGGRPLTRQEYIDLMVAFIDDVGWVRYDGNNATHPYHIGQRGLNRLEEMKNERPND